MKVVRWLLGRIILLVNALTLPKPLLRSADDQALVDAQTADLTLYQYQACPFCVKVRRQLRRLNLKVGLRDPRASSEHMEELMRDGGELKVPCLKIVGKDNAIEWLYESSDIIDYLETRFAPVAA
jgi:glutaredoxin